jgi:hypothetical protein
MNAKELADKAEQLKTGEYGYVDGWMDEAADMIRQQEDLLQQHEKHNLELQEIIKNQKGRIAELEKTIQDGIQSFGILQEQMLKEKLFGAEPVAWINRHMDDGWLSWDKDSTANVSTPLYTTSQIKELSDKEISLVIWESYQSIGNATLTDLCKAILKKASEK